MPPALDGLYCCYCGRRYKTENNERYLSHVRQHRKRYYGRHSLYSKWFPTRNIFLGRKQRMSNASSAPPSHSPQPSYINAGKGSVHTPDRETTLSESSSVVQESTRIPLDDNDDVQFIDIAFPLNSKPPDHQPARTLCTDGDSRPSDWQHVFQWREFWDKQLRLPVKDRQPLLGKPGSFPSTSKYKSSARPIAARNDHVTSIQSNSSKQKKHRTRKKRSDGENKSPLSSAEQVTFSMTKQHNPPIPKLKNRLIPKHCDHSKDGATEDIRDQPRPKVITTSGPTTVASSTTLEGLRSVRTQPANTPTESLTTSEMLAVLTSSSNTSKVASTTFQPPHETLVHKCQYCGDVLSSEEELIEHVASHTGKKPYLCLVCNARFALVTNFRAHEKSHVGVNSDDPLVSQGKQPVNGSCIDNDEKRQADSSTVRPVGRPKRGEKTELKCDYCGAIKNDMRTLIEHVRIHTGERPLTCRYCSMTFAYRGSRNKHERRHEKRAGTLDETATCNVCDLKCTNKNALREHTSKEHSSEKPFKCRYCGKCFSHKCNVESHERLHTGDRPFTCPLCPAAFTQLSQRVSHVRTHTGERPYHCRYCEKEFRTSSVRKNHERTHTGEKPYHCSFCSATFARRTNLNQHLISHTDVKPKQCQFCGKGLTSNRSLKRHEEAHRRKEQTEKIATIGLF